MSGLQPKVGLKAENAHADGIWTLAWSGSERVLTGSLDGSIRLWNSRSLASPISATPRENVGINSLVVNDDGNMAIACYQDSYIRFFSIDPNSGVLNETKEMKNELLTAWTLSLSPDDDTYVIGSQAGKVYLSSIKEEKRLHTLKLPTPSHVLATAFNADGSLFACSSVNGALHVFDPVRAELAHAISAHNLPARSVKFSPDGNLIYTASDDQHVSIFDLRRGSMGTAAVKSYSMGSKALCVDVSPDGRHFCVGTANGNVLLWDLGMQRRECVYNGHSDQVWAVAYDRTDRQGKRFASVGDDALLQLYA